MNVGDNGDKGGCEKVADAIKRKLSTTQTVVVGCEVGDGNGDCSETEREVSWVGVITL